jgi:hypothetical protein
MGTKGNLHCVKARAGEKGGLWGAAEQSLTARGARRRLSRGLHRDYVGRGTQPGCQARGRA